MLKHGKNESEPVKAKVVLESDFKNKSVFQGRGHHSLFDNLALLMVTQIRLCLARPVPPVQPPITTMPIKAEDNLVQNGDMESWPYDLEHWTCSGCLIDPSPKSGFSLCTE